MGYKLLRALMVVVFGFLFLMHGGARAAESPVVQKALIYQDARMVLLLTFKPCASAEVLRFIRPDKRAGYKAANLLWQGQALKACWRDVPDGALPEPAVFVVDETGDAGAMLRSWFREDDGQGPVKGVGV